LRRWSRRAANGLSACKAFVRHTRATKLAFEQPLNSWSTPRTQDRSSSNNNSNSSNNNSNSNSNSNSRSSGAMDLIRQDRLSQVSSRVPAPALAWPTFRTRGSRKHRPLSATRDRHITNGRHRHPLTRWQPLRLVPLVQVRTPASHTLLSLAWVQLCRQPQPLYRELQGRFSRACRDSLPPSALRPPSGHSSYLLRTRSQIQRLPFHLSSLSLLGRRT